MLDLSGYKQIRAFVEAYVLGDERIPDQAFVWGNDKRMLDKQASTVPSPFFWVSQYKQVRRTFQGGEQVYIGWELRIEVKGAVGAIDKIFPQEAMLDRTLKILNDFLAFLVEMQKKGRLIFDMDNRPALPDEGYEMEGCWGWEVNITIATPVNCYKVSGSSYTVNALIPVWSGSSGDLTITVSGIEITQAWPAESRITETLFLLEKAINASVAPETAFTNGAVLFIRDESQGANFTAFDLVTNNHHSWELIEILGR